MADRDIDPKGSHQGRIVRAVDQGHGALAAGALGEERCQNIDFVVIRHGDHRLGHGDVHFRQNIAVKCIAMNDGRPVQGLREILRALGVHFDDLEVQFGMGLFQGSCQKQADIAAADNHHAARFLFLMPERRHGTFDMFAVGNEIYLVTDQHLIVATRHDQIIAAHDSEDDDIEIGKYLGQLAERRIHDRAAVLAAYRDHAQAAVAERQHVESAGQLQTAFDGMRDFDFRRNDQIDRQMIRAVKIRPGRLQIALIANARYLFGHAKYGMGDLAGDHIDLVRIGHGDDHVGILRAGLVEHVRQRCIPHQAPDFRCFQQLLHDLRIVIDHSDVIRLAGKLAGDARADLAGATNDDPHPRMPRTLMPGRPPRPRAPCPARDRLRSR